MPRRDVLASFWRDCDQLSPTMSGDRYGQLRDHYSWQVPARYNIAADACDARDPDALAMR